MAVDPKDVITTVALLNADGEILQQRPLAQTFEIKNSKRTDYDFQAEITVKQRVLRPEVSTATYRTEAP